jgi:hypothetical protein
MEECRDVRVGSVRLVEQAHLGQEMGQGPPLESPCAPVHVEHAADPRTSGGFGETGLDEGAVEPRVVRDHEVGIEDQTDRLRIADAPARDGRVAHPGQRRDLRRDRHAGVLQPAERRPDVDDPSRTIGTEPLHRQFDDEVLAVIQTRGLHVQGTACQRSGDPSRRAGESGHRPHATKHAIVVVLVYE